MSELKFVKITEKYVDDNPDKAFNAWRRSWDGSFWADYMVWDKNEHLDYLKSILRYGVGYMIKDEDEIVGFVFGTFNHIVEIESDEERALYNKHLDKDFGVLNELAVQTVYRGQGLGRKLAELYFEECHKKGIKKVLLYTEKESRSQNLYRRLGFKEVGELEIAKPNHPAGVEHRRYFLKKL